MPTMQPALTIDFWNTMVVARSNGERRQRQRMAYLQQVARRCLPGVETPDVEAAYRAAVSRFDADWRERHSTPPTSELVGCIWKALGITVDAEGHAETVRLFEEGLLFGPPDLTEGLAEALAWASERYPLAIVSDTMFSPGRVIRQLLDRHGLLQYFSAFVFSDETGFSKPDVRAFERAAHLLGTAPHALIHIGDLRRTDVAGAHRVSARSLLFTGVHHDDTGDHPAPHALLPGWADLPGVLATLQAPSASPGRTPSSDLS